MFTIEHEFDHTKITVLDEGSTQERYDDIVVKAYDDHIEVTQYDLATDCFHEIHLSMDQLQKLAAALRLPEGSYKRA